MITNHSGGVLVIREHDCSPQDYAVVIDVIHVIFTLRITPPILLLHSLHRLSHHPSSSSALFALLQVMYAIVWEHEDPHFCSTYTAWYVMRPQIMVPVFGFEMLPQVSVKR
jgi:hypothetical protein